MTTPKRIVFRDLIGKRITVTLIAVAIVIGVALGVTSRTGIAYQLEYCKSALWVDGLIQISEWRYAGEPEFQRTIALLHYDRFEKERELAWIGLNRIIEASADPELKITPLLKRAKIWEGVGRWENALKDLDAAIAIVRAREARGVFYFCCETTGSIKRHIEFIQKRMERDCAKPVNSPNE